MGKWSQGRCDPGVGRLPSKEAYIPVRFTRYRTAWDGQARCWDDDKAGTPKLNDARQTDRPNPLEGRYGSSGGD